MLIRRRLIILTVLPLVLSALAISGVLIWMSQSLQLKGSFDYQKTLAGRFTRGFYENNLAVVVDTLRRQERFFNLLLGTGYQTLNLKQQEEYMKELVKRMPEQAQLLVLDTHGWQEIKLARVGNEVISEGDRTSEAESKGFILAMKDRVYMSPVFLLEGANHVEIAVPLKDPHGNVIKVLKAKVNVEKIWLRFLSVSMPKSFTAYLVDNRGNIIAHPERSVINSTRNVSHIPIIQDFLSSIPCSYGKRLVYETVTGAKVMGVYAPIPEMGWAVVVERPAVEVYKPLYIIFAVGVGVTFLFLGGFLPWSALSAKSITSAMAKLLEATETIAGGNLDYKVEIRSHDELGLFAEALNKMTGDLKNARAEIEQRNIELAAANKELEAFAYSVSHDLRAPLRSIDGFSQAVLEDYAHKLDAQGEDCLRRVRAASQRMGQLIDDMLKLSRVTRSEMRPELVNLSALAKTVATELQKTQPERQVEFVVTDGLVAKGDAQLLQIMLSNLLDNAWKFTSKHPRARVEFGVTQHEGKPAYFVRDDGAGFDVTYADKLFAPFQRLHTTTEFPGTGIGLATVQRIIRRHGGQVWAEGEAERGATFYFTL